MVLAVFTRETLYLELSRNCKRGSSRLRMRKEKEDEATSTGILNVIEADSPAARIILITGWGRGLWCGQL